MSQANCSEALLLRDRTILVSQQQGLEIDNLIAQLSHLLVETVILGSIYLNLLLQIGKPLLLSLPTLQSSNPERY
jgi:hypothetical protein